MAEDGSIVFNVDADDKSAQRKLNALRKNIEKTAKALDASSTKRNGIVEELRRAQEEANKTAETIREAKAQMAENEATLSGRSGNINLEEFEARKQAQQELEYELKNSEASYKKQQSTVDSLAKKEAEVTRQMQEQARLLETQKAEAGAYERSLAVQSSTMPQISEAAKAASSQIKKGFKNILKWGFGIRSLFILIRRLRSYVKEAVNAFAENDPETKANLDALKNSLAQLKASWGAAFAPIVNAVAPILQKLISWLTAAANAVAQFMAILSGRGTFKKAIANNEKLAESIGGAGGAAEEAEKQIMGFDEINKLNAQNSGGGGGGGGAAASGFEDVAVNDKFAKFIEVIKGHLTELELFAAGTALGLGLVLTFSGANIPLGLALIAVGAIGIAKVAKENWDEISSSVKKALSSVAMVAGGLMFGIGLALALSGVNVPVGLGLIAAGLVTAGSAVINWDEIPAHVREELAEIAMVVGASLLAFGAILAFSGVGVGVGIGLMIAGAAALGSGIALNWNYMDENVRGALGRVLATLGAGLVAVGLILTLTGVAAPLGIGLMLAGGVGIGSAVALNWNYFTDKIKKVLEDINKEFQSAKIKLETKVSQLRDSFVQKFDAIKEKAQEIIEKIREFFSFHWQLPHINLPHLTVSWEPAGDLGRFFGFSAIPNVGIEWYARGGIVDGATLIGAGEAGKEAIIPLERNTGWINMVADALIDRITSSRRLVDAISGMPMPALAAGRVVPPNAYYSNGSSQADLGSLVSAIVAGINTTNDNPRFSLYIDGEQITNVVTKRQNNNSRRAGR